jgi:hypothetical protein
MVLHFEDETASVDYAHQAARMIGASVLIFNRRGDVEFSQSSKPITCAKP